MITLLDLTEKVTRLDYLSETSVSSILPIPNNCTMDTKDFEK
jgi:hypothetical protein